MQRTICLLFGTLLALSGCTSSRYWLPGLTLPQQTMPMTKVITTQLSPALSNMPDVGPVAQVLTIGFSGADWDGVKEHFNTRLAKMGFVDETNSMLQILPAAGSHMQGAEIVKWTRMYSNPASQYVVILLEMKHVNDPAAHNETLNFPGVGSSSAQYNLCVVKKK